MAGSALRRSVADWLRKSRIGREAMAEGVTLSLLRTRPTPRVWLGLVLVAFSYVIGWPAVGLLAFIAYALEEPFIIAFGGPMLYGFSHLVFFAGYWLAGARYVKMFFLWTIRRMIEKMERGTPGEIGEDPAHFGQ